MSNKRIMVADDEPDILDIVVKKLREHDYEVMGFSEGQSVVDKCRIFNPDLIILDIVMPGVDGYSVATHLRMDKNVSAPIIFMTAKELDRRGIDRRMADLGSCDFIGKPCTFEDLLEKIREKIG